MTKEIQTTNIERLSAGRHWSSGPARFLACAALFLVVPALAGFSAPVWPPSSTNPAIVYAGSISTAKDIGVKPPLLSRFGNWLTGVTNGQKRLDKPFGLSLDETGHLLVTDTGANTVCYLDLAGKKWLQWSGVGNIHFASPVAAVHHGRKFYVADSALGRVIAFDEQGKLQFVITNELERPTGLAFLNDHLLVVDSQRHQVVICDAGGKFISKFGHRGAGAGEFNFPTHVTVDGAGRIYVTDSMNCRIQVFDAAGKFLREFGGAGDGPGRFSRPKGVAADTDGHVYVVDALFNNVQIFNDSGRLLLDWGGGGAGPGEFWLPNAIVINPKNEIFIADVYNHRIQEFRYTGKHE